MNWLDKLERRFGRFAIENLMLYIVVANAVVLILTTLMPLLGIPLIEFISFSPHLVLQGQIWRIFTFVFIPPTFSLFFGAFALLFYYSIGTSLEHTWGTFRFNIYYLLGVFATAIASLVFVMVTKSSFMATPLYLNLSLFLAYAKLYPENRVSIYFIIPIKIKYLAWLNWALLLYDGIVGGWGTRILIIISLANYFLFFGKQNIRALNTRRQVNHRRREFKKDTPKVIYIHRCSVCGITDRDDPDMEFRYCSKCDGHYEYCMNHIFDHEHK